MIRKIILAVTVALLVAVTLWGGSVTKAESDSEGAASSSASNIVVERSGGSSVIEGLENRVETSWPWYLTRASGLVAAMCLVVLMLSGIGLEYGQIALLKSIINLVIQIHPVCNDDNFGVTDTFFQGNGLSKHDHRQ